MYTPNWASLVAQMVKNLPVMQETQVWYLGQEEPLGKEIANPLQYSWLENPMDRRSAKSLRRQQPTLSHYIV